MNHDYAERRLLQVNVEVRRKTLDQPSGKSTGYSCDVAFMLEAAHRPTAVGPKAVVSFAIPGELGATFQEVEGEAIAAAAAIIRRLAALTPDELELRLQQPIEFDFGQSHPEYRAPGSAGG